MPTTKGSKCLVLLVDVSLSSSSSVRVLRILQGKNTARESGIKRTFGRRVQSHQRNDRCTHGGDVGHLPSSPPRHMPLTSRKVTPVVRVRVGRQKTLLAA